MDSFIQRLAERIEQAQPEALADSLTDANEIMRMWSLFGGDPNGSAVVGPFSEEVEYPHVQADDVERLKHSLLVFVKNFPHHPQLGSAVHALYYLAAPDTKAVLIKVLEDCLGRDSAALYQTILALEALGENIYGSLSSSSYDEVEVNEKVAREYLSTK